MLLLLYVLLAGHLLLVSFLSPLLRTGYPGLENGSGQSLSRERASWGPGIHVARHMLLE